MRSFTPAWLTAAEVSPRHNRSFWRRLLLLFRRAASMARMKLMSPQTAEPSAMSLNDGFALSLSGELQRYAFHELTTHLPVESVDRNKITKLFDASEP
jgi:hypothetical protein